MFIEMKKKATQKQAEVVRKKIKDCGLLCRPSPRQDIVAIVVEGGELADGFAGIFKRLPGVEKVIGNGETPKASPKKVKDEPAWWNF